MDYSGILIEKEDGKMLFQLRDNNPKIKNRNCWSLFGGGINNGEQPIDAAIRELKEELGLTIKKEQLRPLAVFLGIKKRNYLFKLRLHKEIKKLNLNEGASMDFFTISEILFKKNLVRSLRVFLI